MGRKWSLRGIGGGRFDTPILPAKLKFENPQNRLKNGPENDEMETKFEKISKKVSTVSLTGSDSGSEMRKNSAKLSPILKCDKERISVQKCPVLETDKLKDQIEVFPSDPPEKLVENVTLETPLVIVSGDLDYVHIEGKEIEGDLEPKKVTRGQNNVTLENIVDERGSQEGTVKKVKRGEFLRRRGDRRKNAPKVQKAARVTDQLQPKLDDFWLGKLDIKPPQSTGSKVLDLYCDTRINTGESEPGIGLDKRDFKSDSAVTMDKALNAYVQGPIFVRFEEKILHRRWPYGQSCFEVEFI